MNDPLILGGKEFQSRFLLGTGKFSLDKTAEVIERGNVEIVTLALRRANLGGDSNILDYIPDHITLLPNTSGARNAQEAVRIARLAQELGCGNFVKIEVIHDSKYLMPDNYETIKATEILAKEGFVVLPLSLIHISHDQVFAVALASKRSIRAINSLFALCDYHSPTPSRCWFSQIINVNISCLTN